MAPKKSKAVTLQPTMSALVVLEVHNPRRTRFRHALHLAYPLLTNDEMDMIEPVLTRALGRNAVELALAAEQPK